MSQNSAFLRFSSWEQGFQHGVAGFLAYRDVENPESPFHYSIYLDGLRHGIELREAMVQEKMAFYEFNPSILQDTYGPPPTPWESRRPDVPSEGKN